MNRKVTIVLALALTSGGLASYLSLGYMSQTATAAAPPARLVSVMLTARALAPGTVIGASDIQQVRWAADTPPVGLFTRPEEVVGRVVTVALGAGEPVMPGVLAPEGAEGGLPGLIPSGKRAISVAVDEVVGVNGFVAPGARVDVVATLEAAAGVGEAVSRVVLQDVEVLASGHQLQAEAGGAPQQAPVVTLLVAPAQAEALVLALHKGRIHLVLRSHGDRGEIATPGVRTSVLTGAAAAPERPQAPSMQAEKPSTRSVAISTRIAPPDDRVVEVINGSERTVVRY